MTTQQEFYVATADTIYNYLNEVQI